MGLGDGDRSSSLELICLGFRNADIVLRVVDVRIDGNVLASEEDVVVERTITC